MFQILFAIGFLWNCSAETLDQVKATAIEKMLANISRPDAVPGSVMAATSKENPNYYFHWVRDGALVMDVVASLFRDSEGSAREKYRKILDDYLNFSMRNQSEKTLTGLGEPKFFPDGRPFSDDWGRPQNDGPALRAIALMNYEWADGNTNSQLEQVVARDLDYVVRNLAKPGFDIWEEVKGQHFFTLMVQRRALNLAARRYGIKLYYLAETQIENLLQMHVNDSDFIKNTMYSWAVPPNIYSYKSAGQKGAANIRKKFSNLDSSVIIALLRGETENPFLKLSEPKVSQTVRKLHDAFYKIYDINHLGFPNRVPVIGRYPEDVYFDGNPWFLTTFAIAEYYYKLARETRRLDDLQQGDQYLARGLMHRDQYGNMSEQISKTTGHMLSAENLTWSYASLVTAIMARSALSEQLRFQKQFKVPAGINY